LRVNCLHIFNKIETVDAKAPEPVKQAMETKAISINKAFEATKAKAGKRTLPVSFIREAVQVEK